MPLLLGRGCVVGGARSLLLHGGRTESDAVRAAIETRVVDDRGVVDDVLVVHVRDRDVGDVGHRAVVEERAPVPVATREPGAEVAEAVIDAAVEPHPGTPVAWVPAVEAFLESPIAGRPQQARGRSQDPGARYPVVAFLPRIVCPVAGHPQVAHRRARGLYVHRQGRRLDADRNPDTPGLRVAGHRSRQQSEHQEQGAKAVRGFHRSTPCGQVPPLLTLHRTARSHSRAVQVQPHVTAWHFLKQ